LELLQSIFPEADFFTFDKDTGIYTLYNEGRSELGYAFYGSSRGYEGEIVVLVGLEDKETIRGTVVTSQSETYSYWIMLVYGNFFEQFIGLKIEDCAIKEGGGQIDAITGATISSWAVVDAVRSGSFGKD
jgi:electron transport complex protein RnfG